MTPYIDPDREAFRQFAQLSIDGPIDMLNLIKLKDQATYNDGRAATGAEAYKAYTAAAASFFQEVGGKIVWRGQPRFPLIGPGDETWDTSFVARYPNQAAFLSMVKNEGYQAIIFHRQAGVLTSRLHCHEVKEERPTFG